MTTLAAPLLDDAFAALLAAVRGLLPVPRGGIVVSAMRARADGAERTAAHDAADAAIVARAADGDASALRELYGRYGASVHALALRVLRDREAAEECTQDVFVAVWRNAASYDPSRARLSTWIFAIARNRALELLRRRAARPLELHPDAPEPALPSDDDAASAVARLDAAARVATAIAELPDEQQDVVRAAYFEGLTHVEIAARLGVPLGTVKGRLRLALEKLRPVAEALTAGGEA